MQKTILLLHGTFICMPDPCSDECFSIWHDKQWGSILSIPLPHSDPRENVSDLTLYRKTPIRSLPIFIWEETSFFKDVYNPECSSGDESPVAFTWAMSTLVHNIANHDGQPKIQACAFQWRSVDTEFRARKYRFPANKFCRFGILFLLVCYHHI